MGALTDVPVVAGFDVSPNRCGWAFVARADARPIGCGVIDMNLPASSWRCAHVREQLAEVLARFLRDPRSQVVAVYRERPAFPERSGPKSAHNAGRAVGVVDAFLESLLPGRFVIDLAPASWRKDADVPRGATLDSVRDAVDPPWPTRDSVKPDVYLRAVLLGFDPEGRQDAADAACIARAGWRREVRAHESELRRREALT